MRPPRPSSDWFNPMLVRDLRQGLRSRLFTTFFLVLQGAMVFFIVLQLPSGAGRDAGDDLGRLLYLGFGIFYFLVMPLIACTAFGAEYREGRLDLLKLTQLSARQLVLGKWTSLVVQIVLVTVSMLPYLVLRYFIGGVDLATELAALGLMLVCSIELVGFCLAIACLQLVALRLLATVALMVGIFMAAGGLAANPVFGGPRGWAAITGQDYAFATLLLAGAGLPVLWLAFEFAAARLAPPSENHDTAQRWALPLLLLVGGGAAAMGMDFTTAMLIVVSALVIWVLMHAASGEPSPYPSTYRPFVRFRLLGRLAGRLLLYPGWPSSVPLILLTCAAMGAICFFAADPRDAAARAQILSLWLLAPGAVLFPQVAGWLLRHSRFTPPVRYLFVLALCFVLVILVVSFSEYTFNIGWPLMILCLLPPSAWMVLGFNWLGVPDGANSAEIAWMAAVIGNVPTLIAAMLGSLQYWPHFSFMEKFSAASAPEPPPAARPPAAPSEPPSPSGASAAAAFAAATGAASSAK